MVCSVLPLPAIVLLDGGRLPPPDGLPQDVASLEFSFSELRRPSTVSLNISQAMKAIDRKRDNGQANCGFALVRKSVRYAEQHELLTAAGSNAGIPSGPAAGRY